MKVPALGWFGPGQIFFFRVGFIAPLRKNGVRSLGKLLPSPTMSTTAKTSRCIGFKGKEFNIFDRITNQKASIKKVSAVLPVTFAPARRATRGRATTGTSELATGPLPHFTT